jgi:hypothetical protein
VVTGIISVDSFDASVLFDSGTSFSFVSEGFVVRASLSMQKISQPVLVSSVEVLYQVVLFALVVLLFLLMRSLLLIWW